MEMAAESRLKARRQYTKHGLTRLKHAVNTLGNRAIMQPTLINKRTRSVLPEPVASARRRRPREAARAVAQRYLQAVIYANEHQLQSVLAERGRTKQAVVDLVRAGVIQADRQIDGLAGKWLLLAAAAQERCSPAPAVLL